MLHSILAHFCVVLSPSLSPMQKSTPVVVSLFFSITAFFATQIMLPLTVRADAPNPADYIWIEGEAFGSAEPAAFKPAITNASPTILSDGKWLNFSIEAAHHGPGICGGGRNQGKSRRVALRPAVGTRKPNTQRSTPKSLHPAKKQ